MLPSYPSKMYNELTAEQSNEMFADALARVQADANGDFAKFQQTQGYKYLAQNNTLDDIQRYVASKIVQAECQKTETGKIEAAK